MASINNLEISETISNNPNIKISKGFLGIGSKAIYTPTNSKLNAVINYYSAEDAQAFVKLINAAETEVASQAKKDDTSCETKHQQLPSRSVCNQRQTICCHTSAELC